MPDILHEVTMAASPDKVYQAITEEQASWWTSQAIAQPKVGSVGKFSFPSGFVIKMEIANLEPGTRWLGS